MATETKYETRTVYVKLTAAEQRERAMQAAELLRRRDEADAHQKLQAKLLKQEVEKHEEALRKVALAAREGTELQDVECEWIADFATKHMQLRRCDNGAVVETRSMTSAERQTELELS